jgi:hypothetical protein
MSDPLAAIIRLTIDALNRPTRHRDTIGVSLDALTDRVADTTRALNLVRTAITNASLGHYALATSQLSEALTYLDA